MNSLLEQLHDIEGLDSISSWPLAVGWWVLIAFVICLTCAIASFFIYRQKRKLGWEKDMIDRLAALKENLSEATAKETLIVVSEYLRRIAIQRFSRQECAGLVGEDWIKWLGEKDPKSFDWQKRGKLLMDQPYAPGKGNLSVDQVHELIQAVRNWVR